MRKIQYSILLIFLFSQVWNKNLHAIPSPPNKDCVTLYENCNFQGRSTQVCRKDGTFNLGSFNDILSSINIPPNNRVLLFSDSNCGGNSIALNRFSPGAMCLFTPPFTFFNDKTSSLCHVFQFPVFGACHRYGPTYRKNSKS